MHKTIVSGYRFWFFFPVLLGLVFAASGTAKAEGVKQLRPDSAYSSADLYFDNGYWGIYPNFGIQGCAPNYRLYIHVKAPGESILFGLKFPAANVQFNLRKPNGTLAMAGICPATAASPGYIRYYHQAVVGPFPQSGGYLPLEFKVTSIADTGNYYFELVNLSPNDDFRVELWDFQVVSGAHTPAIPADMTNGRVWSQSWQFNAELSYYRLFNGRFFVYSDDGIVTKLTFDDARVGVFTLFCNPTGTLNTGNFISDRKSQNSNTFVAFPGIAQYKVFLNDPDTTLYPSGQYGQILGIPYIAPDPAFPLCSGHKLIVVDVNKSGKVEVRITLPYGSPATDVSIYADVIPGTNNLPWDGKDGQGNPVPDGTLVTVMVQYLNGLTNLPIWDEEQNPNGFGVTLVRPLSPMVPDPMIFWDDTNIGPAYGCPSGSNFTGCISGATGCHTWSGQDCHDKMINSWWYGSTSTIVFNDIHTAEPAVPVGHDGSRCGEGMVLLHATVAPSSTVDWYAIPTGGIPLLSGDTSFLTPVINTTTVYYAEARGDSSGCLSPVRDAVTATVVEAPHPVITGAEMLCLGPENYLYATDPGMVNYIWSISPGGAIISGLGTNQIVVVWSAPGQQWVSVNYTSPAGCSAEIPTVFRVSVGLLPAATGPVSGPSPVCAGTTGVVYMVTPVPNVAVYNWSLPYGVVITAGGGTAVIVVDFLPDAVSGDFIVSATNACGTGAPSPPYFVEVNHAAAAEAGPDTVLCQGTQLTISNATADSYASLIWTSDGLGTLVNETTLAPTYSPAPNETGNVQLTLIASGNPPCSGDTSQMTLILAPKAAVTAGDDLHSCGEVPVPVTGAAAGNYISLYWSTSGTGSFDDPQQLHPTYLPTQQDVNSGSVILTLTANSQSPCPADSGSRVLTLTRPAWVVAGNDTSLCEGVALYLSSANSQFCNGVTWTTSGTGTFDDPHLPHPVYTPSAADIGASGVTLSVTGTAATPCTNAADTLLLDIVKRPLAYAGADGAVCNGSEFVVSGAAASHYSAISWSHNGTGILTNANTFSPTYQPGPEETGLVTLVLNAIGKGSCAASIAEDLVQVTLHPTVNAVAGPDQSIAYGNSALISATAQGGSGFYTYSWEPASLVLDPASKSTGTVRLTGDVTFLLHVIDSISGCAASDDILIRVSKPENTEECLNIHNVITPNGDGANDIWFIDCIESFPFNTVNLFNRWGDLVSTFEGYNNSSVSWGGTNLKGELLPDGTYYYVIAIKDGGTHTGWVFIRGGRE